MLHYVIFNKLCCKSVPNSHPYGNHPQGSYSGYQLPQQQYPNYQNLSQSSVGYQTPTNYQYQMTNNSFTHPQMPQMYQQTALQNQIPVTMKSNPQIDKVKKLGRRSTLEIEETEVTDGNKISNEMVELPKAFNIV